MIVAAHLEKLSNFSLIIWDDVISNSLSEHRSNNDKPFTSESLIEILQEFKNKISASIYVHRQMTPNVYGCLVETEILTIDLSKHVTSKRKANDKELVRILKLFHPPAFLKIKKLRTILVMFQIYPSF